MSIRRVVPDIESTRVGESRDRSRGGVRCFFVRDPNGVVVVKVVTHQPDAGREQRA
jgi:hypothetical protein